MSRGVFELRQYVVRAADMAKFVQLTSEKIALRTAHSPLVGYWNVEFGQINSVVHIWQYDSLAHRAQVRAALAVDTVWNGHYMNEVKPMWQSQSNALLRLRHEATASSGPTGAFALRFGDTPSVSSNALLAFDVLAGMLAPHSSVELFRLPALDRVGDVVSRKADAKVKVDANERVLLLTPLPFSPLK
jgi:hypothetical protein